MNRLLIILLIGFFSQFSFSQFEDSVLLKELDSLELILKNYHEEDSIKVDILIEIFLNKNLIYGKQDSIYAEHREALRISEKIGFKRGEARSLIRLADKFNIQSKTDSALIFSLKAVKIFEKLSFKEDLIEGYSMLSTLYSKTNDFQKSLDMNLKTIELIKNDKEELSYARLYFSTAKSYEGVLDFDNALVYYKKAKVLALKHNFKIGSAIADGAIGHIYKAQKKYEKALPLLLNTLEFSKQSGHNQTIASAQLELGSVYAKLKKYEESIYYYEESIKGFEKLDNYGLLKMLHNDLATSYENKGELENAILNYKISAGYADTLNKKEKLDVVSELQTKYETEKITQEKELAEANGLIADEKAAYSRKMSIGALIFAGVTGLLLLFIFNRLKVIRKQKRELDKAYEMLEESKRYELAASNLKALKSQMNPHFIFNSLNSIQDLILQEDTETSYDYIVLFAELVRNTLTYSNNEFIPFNKEIDFLSVYLKLEQLRFGDEFKFNIETNGIDGIKVPSLIVQPFLENSLKHGLMHKEGQKKLSLEFKLDKELTCIITDNGVGRTESARIQERRGNKTHESFAMGAIEKRLELLSERFDGNFSFEIEDLYQYDIAKGTKISVKIPFEDEF